MRRRASGRSVRPASGRREPGRDDDRPRPYGDDEDVAVGHGDLPAGGAVGVDVLGEVLRRADPGRGAVRWARAAGRAVGGRGERLRRGAPVGVDGHGLPHLDGAARMAQPHAHAHRVGVLRRPSPPQGSATDGAGSGPVAYPGRASAGVSRTPRNRTRGAGRAVVAAVGEPVVVVVVGTAGASASWPGTPQPVRMIGSTGPTVLYRRAERLITTCPTEHPEG